jgi:ADP-ribose pyrophosphatase
LKDLTEHFIAGERVYDGVLLKVHRDVVRLPDGNEGTREYIRHPGAVAIVPVFDDGRVLRQTINSNTVRQRPQTALVYQ